MDTARPDRRKTVTIPQHGFDEMLERAAQQGARHALAQVGLDGPNAAHDIRALRGLLDAFNAAKKAAGLTLIKMLVTGLTIALLAGIVVKLKLFVDTP